MKIYFVIYEYWPLNKSLITSLDACGKYFLRSSSKPLERFDLFRLVCNAVKNN